MSSICFDDELMEDAARIVRLWKQYLSLSDYEKESRNCTYTYGSFKDFILWLEQELDRVNNSKPINTPKCSGT